MGYISILPARRSLKIDIVYIAKNEDDDIDFREGVKKSENVWIIRKISLYL